MRRVRGGVLSPFMAAYFGCFNRKNTRTSPLAQRDPEQYRAMRVLHLRSVPDRRDRTTIGGDVDNDPAGVVQVADEVVKNAETRIWLCRIVPEHEPIEKGVCRPCTGTLGRSPVRDNARLSAPERGER